MVVDIFGIFYMKIENNEFEKEIYKSFKLIFFGFYVFIVVLGILRFIEEE